MKTVWAIEYGSYSDYRVVGVFSSKAKAKVVCDAVNVAENTWGKATIVEWPLDPAYEELNQGLTPWRVLMLKDGTVERCEPKEISVYDISGRAEIWERSKAPAFRGQGLQDALDAVVWAKDGKHATKSVNEMRTQWLVTGRWK